MLPTNDADLAAEFRERAKELRDAADHPRELARAREVAEAARLTQFDSDLSSGWMP